MQQWNKIPDVLPPTHDEGWRNESDWVLAYDSHYRETYIAKYYIETKDDYTGWIMFGADGYRCEPSYWMPLPNPPVVS